MTAVINFLTAVVAFFKALFGGGKAKDPQLTEAKHDQQQAEYGEKVFSQPERDRDAVIADFRMHADDK